MSFHAYEVWTSSATRALDGTKWVALASSEAALRRCLTGMGWEIDAVVGIVHDDSITDDITQEEGTADFNQDGHLVWLTFWKNYRIGREMELYDYEVRFHSGVIPPEQPIPNRRLELNL